MEATNKCPECGANTTWDSLAGDFCTRCGWISCLHTPDPHDLWTVAEYEDAIFIKEAIREKRVFLYGDGLDSPQFTFRADLVFLHNRNNHRLIAAVPWFYRIFRKLVDMGGQCPADLRLTVDCLAKELKNLETRVKVKAAAE